MTVKPDHSYFIDYAPVSKGVDLIERFEKGVARAKADGFEYVYVIENDDWYPANYFEKMHFGYPDGLQYDIVGIPFSHYYHIGNRRHQLLNHPLRASLFCTGFKTKILKDFRHGQNLDISIWKHIRETRCSLKFVYDLLPIGIKHGMGLCAGMGHNKMKLKNEDKDMSWLRSHVDSDAWTFYNTLKL